MHFLALLTQLSFVFCAGYPLYFASFEDVGESSIVPSVLPFEDVDEQITNWLTVCHADTFIIIKDSNPVDTAELYRLRRFAEQARTRGSFIMDYPLNMHELAEDIASHCQASLRNLDIYAEYPVDNELNQRRTFYIEFDSSDRVQKSEFLAKTMAHLTTPYVTIIYSSSFTVPSSIFQNVEVDSKRDIWTERYTDRFKQKKMRDLEVAPLIDEEVRRAPKQAREHRKAAANYSPDDDLLGDDTFATAFVICLGVMAVMLLHSGFANLRNTAAPAIATANDTTQQGKAATGSRTASDTEQKLRKRAQAADTKSIPVNSTIKSEMTFKREPQGASNKQKND